MISITPVQRHIIPAREIHSSTAPWAPAAAAAATAASCPVHIPHSTATTTIPVQIHAIVILSAPSRPIYTAV